MGDIGPITAGIRVTGAGKPASGRFQARRASGGSFAGSRLNGPRLPSRQKIDIEPFMEELFGDPAYKKFVLQDRKRLPARFFARISGALTSRLG